MKRRLLARAAPLEDILLFYFAPGSAGVLQVEFHELEAQEFGVADHTVGRDTSRILNIVVDHLHQIMYLLHPLLLVTRIRINNPLRLTLRLVRQKFKVLDHFPDLVSVVVVRPAQRLRSHRHLLQILLLLLAFLGLIFPRSRFGLSEGLLGDLGRLHV